METTTEYASVWVRRDSSLFLRVEDESDRSKEWSETVTAVLGEHFA